MKFLVTGCAGFIGATVSRRLLERGAAVAGIDNLNDGYDPRLKEDRLSTLADFDNFSFKKRDILDAEQTAELFRKSAPQRVVHLAAQPGVRRSLTHPRACVNANVTGFLNILEGCRATGVEHLTYASSSSVYGANSKLPFSEVDPVSRPVSLYGAAKRANELMAHSYSHLFALPVTGLRYFTVYGPWGRPDMSPMLFAKKIYAGEPLQVFNQGRHRRDFTYIDDAAEATVKVAHSPPSGLTNWDAGEIHAAYGSTPCALYNVGNQNAVSLMDYIKNLETAIGKKAIIQFTEKQPGDVIDTQSDSSWLKREFGFETRTSLVQGVRQFIDWYKSYYKT